ncbi:MAG: protein kinase, partial [Proteobacteria bacterium]|nr:protein kinase [Pseudomonadota bacterium]
MLCYQCLKKIPENSRKCPFCGRLLIPGHPEETASKPAPEKPAKAKPAPEKPAHPKAPPPEPTPAEPGPAKPAHSKPAPEKPGKAKPDPAKPGSLKAAPAKPAPPAPTIPKPPVSPPAEPLALYNIGDIIANRYEVWEILGSGGLGTVYKVQDRGTRRSFILKRILLELINPAVIDRFQKEAATWNKIRHSHLVEVYAYGEDRGSVYFLREYLEGLSLDRLLTVRKNAGVPFSIEEVDPIFSQIALGLDELHQTTFHGDLKPQNIIILPDTLKITDFGIGKILENPDFISSQLAQSDNYYYLAPELISDPKHIGKGSDIYSLGSILYEMLTNAVPRGEILAPSQLNPNLGPALDPIITRALREIYSERYENMLDFARDFYHALGKEMPAIFSPQSIDDLPLPDDFMDIQSSRVLGLAVKPVPEILPGVAAAKPVTTPELPAPEPILISEPPVSEKIDIPEPPAPEPIHIPEPPAPEPVSIPEPPAPEPPAPEPILISEPPVSEQIDIPEPPAPKPIVISEPPAPEPPAPEAIPIPEPPVPEPPSPEPVFIPEPPTPEPPAPEPVFIPEPPTPEPPTPEPVFIPEPPAPEPPAPEPVFIPEPPAPEPPAPEPVF